jgi:carbon storage regulator CsrA
MLLYATLMWYFTRTIGAHMLILQRSIGLSIHIGGNIKVIFLGRKNGGLTIGIEVPKDVPIFRSEIVNILFMRKKKVDDTYFSRKPILISP